MVFATQFGLSVELTKLLPLRETVTTGFRGAVNLARELAGTGSNTVVEEELAEIFGRNRIETTLLNDFPNAVNKTASNPMSRHLDIILQFGAGPTVRRSLRDEDPRYLCTVIQLSFLTSQIHIDFLSSVLDRGLARRKVSESLQTQHILTKDGLSGCLGACREQTAAFEWSLLMDSVTTQLKARLTQAIYLDNAGALHLGILQGFLDVFTSIQRSRGEQLVRIEMPQNHGRAFVLLTVWAHHLLGLTVAVSGPVAGSKVFGTGAPSVFIAVGRAESVMLLDHDDQPLFELAPETNTFSVAWTMTQMEAKPEACSLQDTILASESGYRVLEKFQISHAAHLHTIIGTIAYCFGALSRVNVHDATRRRMVQQAIQFLFPGFAAQVESFIQSLTSASARSADEGLRVTNPFQNHTESQAADQNLAVLLLAFACVDNIRDLADLRITIDPELYLSGSTAVGSHWRTAYEVFMFLMPPLSRKADRSVRPSTFLFSAGGWTYFLISCLDYHDPSSTPSGLLCIKKGVPTRGIVQRRYGTSARLSDSMSEDSSFSYDPSHGRYVQAVQNLTPSTLGPTVMQFVGEDADSFCVTMQVLVGETAIPLRVQVGARNFPKGRPAKSAFLDPVSIQECVHTEYCRRIESCPHRDSYILSLNELPAGCATVDSTNDESAGDAGIDMLLITTASNIWHRYLALTHLHGWIMLRHPQCCLPCAVERARALVTEHKAQRVAQSSRFPGSPREDNTPTGPIILVL